MKYFAALLLVLSIASCSEMENPFVGQWEFDGDKTLNELLESEGSVPDKVLICYKNKSCGYDSVFTYTNNTWQHYFTFYQEGESEPIPYEYELVSDNTYLIKTFAGGKPDEYEFHFINETAGYRELTVYEFTYREYYKKTH